jgi:hypothetical protein
MIEPPSATRVENSEDSDDKSNRRATREERHMNAAGEPAALRSTPHSK